MTQEPMLTSGEAAALLQIHPKTLQRIARRQGIPALRIGDQWRFSRTALDQWIAQQLESSLATRVQ